MNKFFRWANFTANLLIIIAVLLFAGFAVHKYGLNKTPINQPALTTPVIGSSISLAGVNWAGKPKTLILALQTQCRFCNESAPFYKRLIESAQAKHVRLIAVFPTSAEAGSKHLRELGLAIEEVKQSPLSSLQVGGTPTLILANDKGEIAKFWVGKLNSDQEAKLLTEL
jgi:hypothetical protein